MAIQRSYRTEAILNVAKRHADMREEWGKQKVVPTGMEQVDTRTWLRRFDNMTPGERQQLRAEVERDPKRRAEVERIVRGLGGKR